MTQPESDLHDILVSHTEAWNGHDLEVLMSLLPKTACSRRQGVMRSVGICTGDAGRSNKRLARSSEHCRTPNGKTVATTNSLLTMEYPSGLSPALTSTDDVSRSTVVTS